LACREKKFRKGRTEETGSGKLKSQKKERPGGEGGGLRKKRYTSAIIQSEVLSAKIPRCSPTVRHLHRMAQGDESEGSGGGGEVTEKSSNRELGGQDAGKEVKRKKRAPSGGDNMCLFPNQKGLQKRGVRENHAAGQTRGRGKAGAKSLAPQRENLVRRRCGGGKRRRRSQKTYTGHL